MEKGNAVFDSIINSEDEMIKRANITKAEACVYLRAYIIINLFFFKELVISDTSINLNQALRTLILCKEGERVYDLRRCATADFDWLISEGYIKLAARDIFRGNISESLREAQKKNKNVEKPSLKYSKFIDQICKDDNIYWWNASEISSIFTAKIRKELETSYSDDINLLLRKLREKLSDKEALTYNMVKNVALEEHNEKSEFYQIVRGMLRSSFDYNIPEYLKLDYSRQFFNYDTQPTKKFDLEIDITSKYEISCSYDFSIFGFASFPAKHLLYAWETKEYLEFESQMQQFRNGIVNINALWISIEKYLSVINELVVDRYNFKYSEHKQGITFNPKAILHTYNFKKKPVVASMDIANKGWGIADTAIGVMTNPISIIAKLITSVISSSMNKMTAPPREIKQAIVKLDK